MNEQDLVYRLRKRAEIRRQIPGRKSVEEGKPDRIADLLEEAANELEALRSNAQLCIDELSDCLAETDYDDWDSGYNSGIGLGIETIETIFDINQSKESDETGTPG